jgi:glycosyltransferase involved in cell wall biosynthesis
MKRLAIVTTHPIQYYAPWFRHLADRPGLDVRVYYLWDFGVSDQLDRGFGQTLRWDVPLLEGYDHEIVPNRSRDPGTHHFRGIDNPDLIRRLRTQNPHTVLCLGYNFATFFKLMMRWPTRRSPLLLRGDSHRLVPQRGLKSWMKRQAVTALFRRFSAFLYVGAANRDYLRLHGVPEDRLFFSPHAIDNERFLGAAEQARTQANDWKLELGIPPEKLVILFAGKFEDKKRPQDLLTAFAAARLPNAALLFVGAGSLERSLRDASTGVPNVYFAGFQNQSLMPRTYAAGDLLVLPSLGGGETWGLCVNEAMCMGKPALVSSHVGCGADLVHPGETGWVFPAGRVDSLTGALREACSDRQRLQQIGQSARRHVQKYDYQEATRGLEAALDWLSSSPSRSWCNANAGHQK